MRERQGADDTASPAACVNGAARGDLSSEKVYVKLARMTCAQPGGRYAVSEVKGFIRLCRQVGRAWPCRQPRRQPLVRQALLAGIVGGFGRGFSANANGIFTGQIGADGKRQALRRPTLSRAASARAPARPPIR